MNRLFLTLGILWPSICFGQFNVDRDQLQMEMQEQTRLMREQTELLQQQEMRAEQAESSAELAKAQASYNRTVRKSLHQINPGKPLEQPDEQWNPDE